MFCIQFKRDFFKICKTEGIYDKTDKCFGKEMFSEQKNAGGKKRKNQPFTEPAVTPRMIDRDRKM